MLLTLINTPFEKFTIPTIYPHVAITIT